MTVPLPGDSQALRTPPDAAEATLLVRGFSSAAAGSAGLTEIQRLLFEAITRSMTGHRIDVAAARPIEPTPLAQGLRLRDLAFRSRIVQIMVLGEMVLTPIPSEVSERVCAFAAALGVADDMIAVARSYAAGSRELAAADFDRARSCTSPSRREAWHWHDPRAGENAGNGTRPAHRYRCVAGL